jgi:hypothetical protein
MAIYFIHDNSATRINRLRFQTLSVKTLALLQALLADGVPVVQQGYQDRMWRIRTNLADALRRHGRPMDALWAVLPSLKTNPSLRIVCDGFSIIHFPLAA